MSAQKGAAAMNDQHKTTTNERKRPSQIFHPRFASFYEWFARLGQQRRLIDPLRKASAGQAYGVVVEVGAGNALLVRNRGLADGRARPGARRAGPGDDAPVRQLPLEPRCGTTGPGGRIPGGASACCGRRSPSHASPAASGASYRRI